jgi:NAD(P)H dehydrogenase (quinone)
MVLIVYAHPKSKGNGYAILTEVRKQLGRRKYEVLDLYAMKYDPIMHDDELYTAGKKKISKQNLNIQKKIAKSKELIFIYPVWWGTMPAILKGFFDRVLTPPFAFQYVKKPIIGYMSKGNLKGKKATVFLTTGAKQWQSWALQGFKFGHIIKDDVLGFCGIKSKLFHLADCGKWDESRRAEVQKIVSKGLKYLYS